MSGLHMSKGRRGNKEVKKAKQPPKPLPVPGTPLPLRSPGGPAAGGRIPS